MFLRRNDGYDSLKPTCTRQMVFVVHSPRKFEKEEGINNI